ncbi:MAG: hypothetical protein GWO24_05405, partial [Akkermansiaceae bacterium]|nr:hypothetical protein [Akkermansiaceae bacterium]
MLERLQKAGVAFQELKLGPLGLEAVAQLIGDTLHCSPERATPLAELCVHKTDGNP